MRRSQAVSWGALFGQFQRSGGNLEALQQGLPLCSMRATYGTPDWLPRRLLLVQFCMVWLAIMTVFGCIQFQKLKLLAPIIRRPFVQMPPLFMRTQLARLLQ